MILVIGHGQMGGNHVRALRTLGQEVVTVDPDPDAGADYATLRDAPACGIAVIATPVASLPQAAREALAAGMHVLVEKPAGMDAESVAAVAGFAASLGLTFGVGFTERHNPAMALYRAVHHQRPVHLELRRHGPAPDRATAGIVTDLMVHDLDLLRWLGYEPTVVAAHVTPSFASAYLDLGDGATAHVSASYQAPVKTRTLMSYQDGGTVTVDLQHRTLTRQDDRVQGVLGPLSAEPLIAEWEDFLSAVADGREPAATADDAIAALDLVSEIERLGSAAVLAVAA